MPVTRSGGARPGGYHGASHNHNTRLNAKQTGVFKKSVKVNPRLDRYPNFSEDENGVRLWAIGRAGAQRPPWTDQVIQHFRNSANGAGEYTCANCGDDFDWSEMGIDHIVNFTEYIESNSDHDEFIVAGGLKIHAITYETASKLYNDLSNLRHLCKACNSSKSGPKGRDNQVQYWVK